VVGAILAWRDELQQRHQDPLFDVPVPTLNLGHIHGGDNPNRICAECELHIDLRPLPGMDAAELRGELHHRVRHSLHDSGIGADFESLSAGVAPMETAADAPIVTLAEKLTGSTAQAVAFATEAPWLAQLGMDTVVMGPGDIAQAHQPDEYLALDRLDPTINILQQTIKTVCIK
jgi:acetylornithine deacetylase